MMKVFEHEHPLKLIDLQPDYSPHNEDEDEDKKEEEDLVIKEEFRCACNRCGEEINMYHRYYYKCVGGSSCDFSLHKFCAQLPTTLKHVSDPHPLVLSVCYRFQRDWICDDCSSRHWSREIHYECQLCDFTIDVKCAVEVGKNIIYHPCHPHKLMSTISKPIICECSACGYNDKGIFYQCTICAGFTIHRDCAFLPKKLLLQNTRINRYTHSHPLTISYSFPKSGEEPYFYSCMVCGGSFDNTRQWIYKCIKCLYYYIHVRCARSPRITGKATREFKDNLYPFVLHLPFPDETYSLPKYLFSEQTGSGMFIIRDSLQHTSHEHSLLFVETQNNGQTSSNITSSLLMWHNPMGKTQLLCNGCLRPIVETMPFYMCSQRCNFVLHEWCTRLPQKIENHPAHPKHTLVLMYSNALPFYFGVFDGGLCNLPSNGFAYCCIECKYYVDITCGLLPKEISHQAHPDHVLSINEFMYPPNPCHICLKYPKPYNVFEAPLVFLCKRCSFYIHLECALLLPDKIRHKYDKHPMRLRYHPSKGEYFCEVCETDLDPRASFYHCASCVQSIHSACAPLKLHYERYTYTHNWQSIYYFVNIKFGGIHNTRIHPHPLSFAQGIISYGQCSICFKNLQYKMIFECLECKFAIDYNCCKHLNEL